MRLADRVAIVTGSSRGIGKAIAKLFAHEGARVVVNYSKSEKEALAVVDEIKREGGKAIHLQADVSKSDDVRRMVQRTVQELDGVDILVNNAGVHFAKDFFDITEDEWNRTIDVNLKGAYLCSKEVAPIMIKQKRGRIINISSNSGEYHQSAMRFVEYVVSKAGMNGLTRALALKLGPYIRVNAILPGYISTEMVAHFTPEDEKMLMNETAVKRFGNVEDVANAALFLASDESDFITGELMFVTGGRGM
jgi:3-oxoacyl-[acyl-carrier protein] reductase